jgi:hypothetical protein
MKTKPKPSTRLRDGETLRRRRELLKVVIKRSGLTPKDFASQVLSRHWTTVYRWLSGATPVPDAVEEWLLKYAPAIVRESEGGGDES